MRTQAFPGMHSGTKQFGGVLLKGNPRAARPLSFKRPLHLVMRSSFAKGERSFLSPRRAKRIEILVRELARARRIRVYRYANAGNHLHLVVRVPSSSAYKSYIRALTGLIARLTLGAERGRARGVKFWDARPFTRVIEWGRDFRAAVDYVLQNRLEALGFIAYSPRKRALRSAFP